jgi:hypothetical protein
LTLHFTTFSSGFDLFLLLPLPQPSFDRTLLSAMATQSKFLDSPAEVREKIYDYYLDDSTVALYIDDRILRESSGPDSILFVGKQIHTEVYIAYYKRTKLSLVDIHHAGLNKGAKFRPGRWRIVECLTVGQVFESLPRLALQHTTEVSGSVQYVGPVTLRRFEVLQKFRAHESVYLE